MCTEKSPTQCLNLVNKGGFPEGMRTAKVQSWLAGKQDLLSGSSCVSPLLLAEGCCEPYGLQKAGSDTRLKYNFSLW